MKQTKKKIMAIVLLITMLCTLLPTTALAEIGDGYGQCPHHTSHTEECGYYDDYECKYICNNCLEETQSLIDALPSMEVITQMSQDEKANVQTALDEIDKAKLNLSDAGRDQLDFTKYDAACFVIYMPENYFGATIRKGYLTDDDYKPSPQFAFLDENGENAKILYTDLNTQSEFLSVDENGYSGYFYLPEGTYTVKEIVDGNWVFTLTVDGEPAIDDKVTGIAGSVRTLMGDNFPKFYRVIDENNIEEYFHIGDDAINKAKSITGSTLDFYYGNRDNIYYDYGSVTFDSGEFKFNLSGTGTVKELTISGGKITIIGGRYGCIKNTFGGTVLDLLGTGLALFDSAGNVVNAARSEVSASNPAISTQTSIGYEVLEVKKHTCNFDITGNCNCGRKTNSETQVTTIGSAITYGDTLTLMATVSEKAKTKTRTTIPDMVDFYVVKDGNEIPLGTAKVTYNDTNNDNGTATLEVDTIEKALAIGDNTIIAEYGGSVNLNGSKSDSITVKLNPKEVGLTWSGHENLMYDGNAKNVTASAIGFIDGDNVSITVTGGDETNAGTYTATAKLTGADKAYYKLPTNRKEYTIEQATPIENADKQTTAKVRRGKTLAEATVTEGEVLGINNAVLEGSFAWVDDTKVMNADGTEQMIFTPNDTNYAPITINVAVETYTSSGSVAATNTGNKQDNEKDKTEETIWNNPFTDVSESDWFYNAVKYAYQNKLFAGMSATEFAPNMPMSRGMLVTVLYRLAGSPAVDGDMPFVDVNSDAYYRNAILWAVQNNIVSGIADDLFAPDANITREQIAIILYRFAQYCGYDTSVGENTNILSYDDFGDINEYAITAMQYAAGSGFLNGRTESTLNPQDTATRAEVAAILQRFIEGNK